MTYQRRVIEVTFEGAVNATFSGLRCFAYVSHANTPSPVSLRLLIFGLSLSHINSLSRCGTTFYLPAQSSTVTVRAGDAVTGMATIFKGTPIFAAPQFNNQPDTGFLVEATGTWDIQLQKAQPTSLQGAVPAQQALTQILAPAGISVVNNGINCVLRNVYAPGTIWQQALRVVRSIPQCAAYYNSISKQFTIWPKTNPTPSGGNIVISPANGMVGYPEFQTSQVVVKTLFTPNTFVTPSQQVQIKSQLQSANGMFIAYGCEYNLSSEAPGGDWETILTCQPTNLSP